MSAITGIFYRDDRLVDDLLIEDMNSLLNHRGPDGSDVWIDGSIALGHQMLFTTKESLQEKLPFHDEKADLVITADARIDNREELSKKLCIEDNENVSDSHFILKAYSKWGEKCPEKLLGDFAFAIWDIKNKKLFCARDHMGIKPFYYYLTNDTFLFATEIKSIICNPKVPRKLNELKVANHLIPIVSDREQTFYEAVQRLPAAYCLTIKENVINKQRYWQLDPDLEIILDSDEDYYDKFREIFEESIKCRLRSNFKIGFELSGGIDSSSVVVTAKKILSEKNKQINTFSLIFDEIKETDESYFIKKVVEAGAIKSNYLSADSISPFKEMDTILWHYDEPMDTPNLSMIWQLYKMMNKNDIRVLLGGHDGDCALYKGESYLRELFINLKWKKLKNEIKCYSNRMQSPKFDIFITEIIFPSIPKISKIWMRYKKFRMEKDFVNINKKFVERLNLKNYYKKVELEPYKKATNSKKSHYYYLTLATHQNIFEMMDKVAAAFCIEPRHPMMDKRLIEFCYAIPTEIKYNNGYDRLLARIGLADLLPEEVQWRTGKINFFHVFERNLLLYEKDYLEHLIFENKLINDYVDSNEMSNIYNRYQKGIQGADSIDIWKTAIFSYWLENNENLDIHQNIT